MQLFILGLRRSGTTAFWNTFRQDRRFVAYNEPFSPLVANAGDPAWLALRPDYREFAELRERDAAAFDAAFRPYRGVAEVEEGLADRQADYLRFLLGSAEHTVFDFTRAHFKVAALAEIAPGAVLVHLHRPAASWATSHMVPSGSQIPRAGGWRTWLRLLRSDAQKRLDRASFWSRSGRIDTWGLEQVMGASPDSPFGQRLREVGLDPERVYAMPAVARLLAFWRVHYEWLEAAGRRHFGDRFLSVGFDTFCREPVGEIGRVYAALSAPAPELDLSRIRAPGAPFQPEHPDWRRHAEAVGLSAELL